MRICCLLCLHVTVLLSSLTDILKADSVMGNWSGKWIHNSGEEGKLEVQLIDLGNNHYDAIFTCHFPENQVTVHQAINSKPENNRLAVSGKMDLGAEAGGEYQWKGVIANRTFSGTYLNQLYSGRFSMVPEKKRSPTLDLRAPPGAVILFDGARLDAWVHQASGKNATWKIRSPVAEVVPKSGNIVSRQTFSNHKLHLEFRTPFMPEARGQNRGNSGVYLQGRYEVQILDSFGLDGKNNECGGIYGQFAPRVNACLPPTEWQTYDIQFTAAKRDARKKITQKAKMTVVHNGILIHKDAVLKGVTTGSADAMEGIPGPLLLQDHGNLVQFRNIWILPTTD